MRLYRKDAMLDKLENYIFSNYKTASQFASAFGVSDQFVSSVRKGKKNPTKDMLEAIGLKMHKISDVVFSEE